ncbi:MAG: polysaccharide pyruvyl transferase family protein [Fervidobacterium sp.]|uniref:Polysaccharide pyruvyl transferase CsaB n=1 Tax=Fervidobacterium gondwanense DSM 13020 TaxID=1121883 RepID=A0A1M7SIJ2_FERGO|nr:polysaccharide pyruvyl transferase family protein [Fervidobacterium gondwanense]UXF01625.1 polysaccharide pyruvyl transferase [Fervidobacterium riparium]SHN58240.1 polysaccharide pyruvyl transferase CsaB [Fervidobacterium gondwanense DSM 13020]
MKVLLSGYYGYGNFGDELMRLSMEDFFKKYKIDYTIALSKSVSKDTISRFNIFELIGSIFDSDALVYGGGGLLQDITSSKSFLYYAATINIALIFKKPVILFGNSLGPVRKSYNRHILRSILRNKRVYLFTRDIVSFNYAKRLNSNTVLSCDPAVRFLKTVTEFPEKKFDLILIPRKAENIEKYIILKEYFQNIIVCPTQEGDLRTSLLVSKDLGAHLFDQPNDTEGVLRNILASKFIITERFHPALVGAYFGIPFISLENSKAERFFRKYTKSRKPFAKDLIGIEERILALKQEPLYLKEILDKEADESFKKLYSLLIKLKSFRS